MLLVILGVVLSAVAVSYYYLTRNYNYWKKKNVPHLKPVPFFGNYADFMLYKANWGETVRRLCEKFPDEPLIGAYLGPQPVLIVKDPELIKVVTTKDFYYFSGREHSDYSDKEWVLSSLFFTHGDHWKVLRQNLTPLFSSSKMKNMFYLIENCSKVFETLLDKETRISKEQEARSFFARFTMDCIGACAFGIDTKAMEEASKNPFVNIGNKIFEASYLRITMVYLRMALPALFYSLRLKIQPNFVTNFFQNLLVKVFQERGYKQTNKNDFVDLVLSFTENKNITGDRMSNLKVDRREKAQIAVDDDLLTSQCFIFFAAGFETSATTASFLLYELAKDQESQERARQEVRDWLRKRDGRLVYECREVADTYKFSNGLTVDRGVQVHLPALYLHRNPKYFPEPDSFRPERFAPENKHNIRPYTYLPFGEGPRLCIGMRFAKMQVMAGLVTILKKYRVELAPGMPRTLDIEPTAQVTASKQSILADPHAARARSLRRRRQVEGLRRRLVLDGEEAQLKLDTQPTAGGRTLVDADRIKAARIGDPRWRRSDRARLPTADQAIHASDGSSQQYVSASRVPQPLLSLLVVGRSVQTLFPMRAPRIATAMLIFNLYSRAVVTDADIGGRTLVDADLSGGRRPYRREVRRSLYHVVRPSEDFHATKLHTYLIHFGSVMYRTRVPGANASCICIRFCFNWNLNANSTYAFEWLRYVVPAFGCCIFEPTSESGNVMMWNLAALGVGDVGDRRRPRSCGGLVKSLTMLNFKAVVIRIYLFSYACKNMLLVILGVVLSAVAVSYYFLTRNYNYWKKKNVPHTKPVPFFGNFADLMLYKADWATTARRICEKFPDEPLVGAYIGPQPVLIVKDPELIKVVTTKDFYYFSGREHSDYSDKEWVLSSLFFTHGDHWKVLRQNLTPLFSSAKMKNMFYLIENCSKVFETLLDKETRISKKQEARSFFARFTMDCIGACAFGIDTKAMEEASKNPFVNIGNKIFEASYLRITMVYLRMALPALFYSLRLKIQPNFVTNFFQNLLVKVFQDRGYKQTNKNDFVDLVLSFTENKNITGDRMSNLKLDRREKAQIAVDDDLLTSQCFIFFAAGFETSATTASFLLYELAKDQESQERARQEVRDWLRKRDGRLVYECVTELPFLEQCMDETLRLYPVVGLIQREVVDTYKFSNGLTVDRGVQVHLPALYLHRNPKYFPEPDSFRPERFAPENKHNIRPYTYLPFGEGPRLCIGMRFAKMQVMAGLVTILKKYRVELAPGMPRTVEFEPTSQVAASKHGIHLNFIRLNDFDEE
ncbi:hypothetical protein EVAR_8648_1 [Eumeta japonica]|uniref:unspecific monooxygenase n=1 Tax=Eumeta variegata TaxID=151549 RepID=A0A4C1TUF3_EUMVA|nr:hypothetical protein EVAR_8648_1 [Eumeta japonica]